MSMKERKGIVDRRTAAILRCHRLAAAQLPDSDETYRKLDLLKPVREAFDRFIAHGIIKCADRHGAGERGKIVLWRTSRRVARWVDRYVDDVFRRGTHGSLYLFSVSMYGMSDIPTDFDPESAEEREIAGEAARDSADFLSLMGHAYRGEMGRTTSWRTRIDRTTNWAVVLTATLLTWAFSAESRPHYILLIGIVMVTVFLGIEARRYRVYDIWRSRVRILEENVFANALDPEGVEQSNWRTLLSTDFREPTVKTPVIEAVSRRLQRVYFALISVLVAAWVVRLTVFATTPTGLIGTAAVGLVPGEVVLVSTGVYYATVLLLTFWPGSRQAKGELESRPESEEWK